MAAATAPTGLAELSEADILAEFLEAAQRLGGGAGAVQPAAMAMAAFPVNIHGLLARNGADFVANAYAELLDRPPDAQSLARYHEALMAGRLSKIEILGEIRYGREGKALGRNVPSLRQRFLLQRSYRVPVIGRLLRVASALLLLPRALRDLQQMEQAAHADRQRLEALEKAAAASGPQIVVRMTQLETQVQDMARLEQRLAALEQRTGRA